MPPNVTPTPTPRDGSLVCEEAPVVVGVAVDASVEDPVPSSPEKLLVTAPTKPPVPVAWLETGVVAMSVVEATAPVPVPKPVFAVEDGDETFELAALDFSEEEDLAAVVSAVVFVDASAAEDSLPDEEPDELGVKAAEVEVTVAVPDKEETAVLEGVIVVSESDEATVVLGDPVTVLDGVVVIRASDVAVDVAVEAELVEEATAVVPVLSVPVDDGANNDERNSSSPLVVLTGMGSVVERSVVVDELERVVVVSIGVVVFKN